MRGLRLLFHLGQEEGKRGLGARGSLNTTCGTNRRVKERDPRVSNDYGRREEGRRERRRLRRAFISKITQRRFEKEGG